MGTRLFTLEKPGVDPGTNIPLEVFEVTVLADVRGRHGTRLGHARVQSIIDSDDIWDAPYDNLDPTRLEAEIRRTKSNTAE